MELQYSHVAAKKLWMYLRLAFFMMRKSLISKRKKLITEMCFMLKKRKLLWKNIMLNNNSSSRRGHQFGLREYEFSCSNTPVPAYYRGRLKPRRSFLACIDAGDVEEPNDVLPAGLVYAPSGVYDFDNVSAVEEQCSPLIMSPLPLINIVDFLSEDDEEEDGKMSEEIDDKAEEFIRKFYQQLRAQSHIAYINP